MHNISMNPSTSSLLKLCYLTDLPIPFTKWPTFSIKSLFKLDIDDFQKKNNLGTNFM